MNESESNFAEGAVHFWAIVVFCVACAVVYGVLHDQVTARICIEYFTIGHPPVLAPALVTPTTLGIVWGIIATWWVGFGLGLPLAMAARLGHRPKLTVRNLYRPVFLLLCVMAVGAVIFGAIGYVVASRGGVFLLEPLASRVPPEKHVAFLTDLWAHSASYGVGAIGGLVVIVRTWVMRRRSNSQVPFVLP